MSGMSRVEVNKRGDIFPLAVIVNRIGIMCGIQKQFFDMELRQISFHGKKGMQERKHIMSGSLFQERENRDVTMGSEATYM